MNILLTSRHRYPSGGSTARGMDANELATGGSCVVHDLLAKGLAETKQHQIFYHLEKGIAEPLPEGVRLFDGKIDEIDVVHHSNSKFVHESRIVAEAIERNIPYVVTCHIEPAANFTGAERLPGNWIFVSKTMALLAESGRYVTNGVDPSEFIYSEYRGDFILFMSNMHSAEGKGLDTALALAGACGLELVVAGGSHQQEHIDLWAARCRSSGIRFVGDVRGRVKAELLAGARAFLLPTRLNEACPLVLLEALMSGSPLICSGEGACPEICSEEVGFVCRSFEDYKSAAERAGEISPRNCRNRALEKYHYRRMAADYLDQYAREVERVGTCKRRLR